MKNLFVEINTVKSEFKFNLYNNLGMGIPIDVKHRLWFINEWDL